MTLERPDRLVGRNFLVLGGAEAVARAIAFGATIYVARVLGVESYGAIAFAAAIMLYVTQLSDFSVEVIGIREIAEDRSRLSTLAPPLLTARLLFATLVAIAVVALALGFMPEPEGTVLAIYALGLVPLAASTRWIHLGLESARAPAFARLARDAVLLGLVLALVHGPADLVDVPLAVFAGECAFALLLLVWLRRQGVAFPLRLEVEPVKEVVRRAWPLVANSILGLMIYNADLLFLRFFRDLEDVGLYAAGYTLIGFLLNLGVTYSENLLATLARLGGRSEAARALYRASTGQIFALAVPVAFGGAIYAEGIIGTVFGPDYLAAGMALGILIWSIPFSLARNVQLIALIACGRQDRLLWLTGSAAGLNVVLNTLLVPAYGIAGAAAATLATEIVRFGMAARAVSAEGYDGVPLRSLWRPLVAGVAMVAVLLGLDVANLWAGVALGGIVYAGVLILLLPLGRRRAAVPAGGTDPDPMA